MPGLFDNNGGQGGILQGVGTYFNNLAGNMDPQFQENLFRRRAYDALAQQNGPADAAILMGNLPAYGLGFQRELFLNQLRDYSQKHPGADLNEAMYALSPGGQKDIYGPPPVVQGFKFGPYESPGTLQRGPGGWAMQPPPGFPGAAPNSQQQQQPSQQPSALQPQLQGPAPGGLPPVSQQVLEYEKQLAANKKLGEEQGGKAVDVDAAVGQVDRSLALIDELANHPGMKFATGIWANIPGGPPKGTQAYAFAKGIAQLKDQLTLDLMPTLQKMRTSPAVLEFLHNATAGQELDLGTPNMPKNLQDTRNALVQIRGAIQKGANAPVTEAPQAEGPPTFKTQAELRAAIKAGTIKLGQPFRTNDGRTLLAQ